MPAIALTDLDAIIALIRDGDLASIREWQRAEIADVIEEATSRAGQVEALEGRIEDLEQEIEQYRTTLEKLAGTVRDMADDIRDELN